MIWPLPAGNLRGEPPVASSNFSHEYLLPDTSRTCFLSGSRKVARRCRWQILFCPFGFLQIVSRASPFQSDLDNGGRLYGGSRSSPIIPMLPSGSRLRIPPAAASPVIPPPMIKYLKCSICLLPFFRLNTADEKILIVRHCSLFPIFHLHPPELANSRSLLVDRASRSIPVSFLVPKAENR